MTMQLSHKSVDCSQRNVDIFAKQSLILLSDCLGTFNERICKLSMIFITILSKHLYFVCVKL